MISAPAPLAHPASDKALQMLGVRYRWGGVSERDGMDCSGFVFRSYMDATGIALPRTAVDMAKKLDKIMPHEIRAGDLVFFNTRGSTFSHVGIYLGGSLFAHSPKPGQKARIDNLADTYWLSVFDGARRPRGAAPTQAALTQALGVADKLKQPRGSDRAQRSGFPNPAALPALPANKSLAKSSARTLRLRSFSVAVPSPLPPPHTLPAGVLTLSSAPQAFPSQATQPELSIKTLPTSLASSARSGPKPLRSADKTAAKPLILAVSSINPPRSKTKSSMIMKSPPTSLIAQAEPHFDISGMAVALPSRRKKH